MYSIQGLSDVYEPYVDYNGNKFFADYNDIYGDLIRQVKTIDGKMVDSSSGLEFDNIMFELGMIPEYRNSHTFWFTYGNYDKFEYQITCKNYWEGFKAMQEFSKRFLHLRAI